MAMGSVAMGKRRQDICQCFGGSTIFSIPGPSGDTTRNIVGIPAGSYSVTITDSNGCNITDEIELTEPEEFSIAFP
jgi:hypothetical protein